MLQKTNMRRSESIILFILDWRFLSLPHVFNLWRNLLASQFLPSAGEIAYLLRNMGTVDGLA